MTATKTRPHGVTARYVLGPREDGRPGGCRCDPCREAHRGYMADRRRRMAYGTWPGRVDAAPARGWVRGLMAAPEPWKSIAARAGVAETVIARLLWGKKGKPPSRRMHPATFRAIMALRPKPTAAIVDSTGTRRRAHALMCMGWTLVEQARLMGMTPRALMSAIAGPRLFAVKASKMAALYERLSVRFAPPGPLATRARNTAASRGYPPPLAWDDETIDDPAARPPAVPEPTAELVDPIAVERVCDRSLGWYDITRAEQNQVLRRLRGAGWSRTRQAEWLRLGPNTIARREAEL
jgi:hypothetical protein